jgi:hypothetical protein
MSAKNLTINKQSLPERCEICHQADEFDPETQECRRCSSLPVQAVIAAKIKKRKGELAYANVNVGPSARATIAMFLGISSIIPGLCLGPLGMVLGATAFLLGRSELDAIKRNPEHRDNEIFAMVGYYIGISGFIIALLGSIAYCGAL